MLSDTLPPDQTYEYRITPLKWLEDELRGYGLTIVPVHDMAGPYVRVFRDTQDIIVRLDTDGGQRCYRWGEPPTTHPLADPTGAARRLATMLGKGR